MGSATALLEREILEMVHAMSKTLIEPMSVNIFEQEKEEVKKTYSKYGDRSSLLQTGKKINEMIFHDSPKRVLSVTKQIELLFGVLKNVPDKRTRYISIAQKVEIPKSILEEEYIEIQSKTPEKRTFVKDTNYVTFDLQKVEDMDDLTSLHDCMFDSGYDGFHYYLDFVINGNEKQKELVNKYGEIKVRRQYYVYFETLAHTFKPYARAIKYTNKDYKGKKDVYLGTSTTIQKRRLTNLVSELSLNFTELDYYKMDEYKDFSQQEMKELVFAELDKHNFPRPTEIWMPRGLQLIWKITPIPSYHHNHWVIVQRKIFDILKKFNADPAVVTDRVRLLRMIGSVHSKTGKNIHGLTFTDDRYDFWDLFETTCPQEFADLEKRRKKALEIAAKTKDKPFTLIEGNNALKRPKKDAKEETWFTGSHKVGNIIHAEYLQDVKNLVVARNGEMTGTREIVCFLVRYWTLCITGSELKAINEMKNIFYAMSINGSYTFDEILTLTSSSESAYTRWKEDWKKGYNYSGKRLVELLDITPNEQRELKKIMAPDEADRRRKIRDKKKDKARYNVTHEKTRKAIIDATEQNPGLPSYKIAKIVKEILGKCSKNTVEKVWLENGK